MGNTGVVILVRVLADEVVHPLDGLRPPVQDGTEVQLGDVAGRLQGRQRRNARHVGDELCMRELGPVGEALAVGKGAARRSEQEEEARRGDGAHDGGRERARDTRCDQ